MKESRGTTCSILSVCIEICVCVYVCVCDRPVGCRTSGADFISALERADRMNKQKGQDAVSSGLMEFVRASSL